MFVNIYTNHMKKKLYGHFISDHYLSLLKPNEQQETNYFAGKQFV
jgi:hypothetical protein